MWNSDDVNYNDFSAAYTFCENDSSKPIVIYSKENPKDVLDMFLEEHRKPQNWRKNA